MIVEFYKTSAKQRNLAESIIILAGKYTQMHSRANEE